MSDSGPLSVSGGVLRDLRVSPEHPELKAHGAGEYLFGISWLVECFFPGPVDISGCLPYSRQSKSKHELSIGVGIRSEKVWHNLRPGSKLVTSGPAVSAPMLLNCPGPRPIASAPAAWVLRLPPAEPLPWSWSL